MIKKLIISMFVPFGIGLGLSYLLPIYIATFFAGVAYSTIIHNFKP